MSARGPLAQPTDVREPSEPSSRLGGRGRVHDGRAAKAVTKIMAKRHPEVMRSEKPTMLDERCALTRVNALDVTAGLPLGNRRLPLGLRDRPRGVHEADVAECLGEVPE
jgi:hypothetical protein